MKFEIHYSIGDYKDCFIVEGKTIEEVRQNARKETDKRNLSEIKNDLWSLEIPT